MYKCEVCNLDYSSRMGLYKHNKQFHADKIGKVGRRKIEDKNYICSFCNKEFNHNQNKWLHEKTCKHKKEQNSNEDFIQMKNEIEQLKKKIETLENKPKNTINNTTNNTNNTTNLTNNTTNNTINNITVVIPFGKEPLNCIPEAEIIKTLEECGINAIVKLCKTKHFNPDKPELQNFCVTAKNDPYAIVVDSETKRAKAVNKKEVFDKAYYGVVMNIESVQSQNPEVIETKDKIKAVSMSKNMMKHVRTAINEEAYHNKDMVQTTWKNSTFEGIKQEKPDEKPEDKPQILEITKSKTRKELITELDEFLTEAKGVLHIEV